VSLDSWVSLEGMINVVKRTGHCSYYLEKGMSAMGKSAKELGIQEDGIRVSGGAFPIWLENAPCCPIAIVACYSGSSQDDHTLVSTAIRDYLLKLRRNSQVSNLPDDLAPTERMIPPEHKVHEWAQETELPPSDRLAGDVFDRDVQ